MEKLFSLIEEKRGNDPFEVISKYPSKTSLWFLPCDADFPVQWYREKENQSLVYKRFMRGYWAVVTRSQRPTHCPWKRIGARSYLWLVPSEEVDDLRGRRIEWGGDTHFFRTRKEGLQFMYGEKK